MSRPSQTHLINRLRQLSLNSPPQTALFYARLFHALCPLDNNHESLHILALCLFEVGETYSALHVVRDQAERGCGGCAMVLARCCQKLGRFGEGQAVLQRAMTRGNVTREYIA
jgi:anaphase-promoting complex subunit 3